jgi:hypothetical protein
MEEYLPGLVQEMALQIVLHMNVRNDYFGGLMMPRNCAIVVVPAKKVVERIHKLGV